MPFGSVALYRGVIGFRSRGAGRRLPGLRACYTTRSLTGGIGGFNGARTGAFLNKHWQFPKRHDTGRGLRTGLHDASAVDSSSSVVPFLVGLGGGLFYGRFLLGYRASILAGFLL